MTTANSLLMCYAACWAGMADEWCCRLRQVDVEAACSTATLELPAAGGETEELLAIGTGCQGVSEVQSVLQDAGDHLVKLDRPSLSDCVGLASGSECRALKAHPGESLWHSTVGWWEFDTRYVHGSFERGRSSAKGCAEQYATHIQPSSFRNLRLLGDAMHDAGGASLLGPAVLQGPQCKGQDWDRPPERQVPSALCHRQTACTTFRVRKAVG